MEIERAHLNCFPKVGEIRAGGLMVYCHIGEEKIILIHIEVCSRRVSDKSGLSESLAAEIRDQTSNSCNITDSLKHENSLSSDQNEARKSSALLENPSETFSETVSVLGVMMKYFSDYDEFTPKTPPRNFPSMLPTDLSCKTSRNNIKRPDVGKRLLLASNKLGISANSLDHLVLRGIDDWCFVLLEQEWYHEDLEFDLDVSVA
ncbi:hypothetical protein RHSIM_Rhsim10G0204100 [Rhododendron simsii]|uniref:Uncharacterized protein n=1 Tax=Rhododendron simsii TaxID=118357 RepID=A0A834GE83_RHOSS|nr:hypothetical protein RHSIM_Rhsim10G0204100 [Rhododendron simsii]